MADVMTVKVAYGPLFGPAIEYTVTVPRHANVAMVLKRSGLFEKYPELVWPPESVGIYARRVTLDASVKAQDRIEVYRPLKVDPKKARLLRLKKS